MLQFRVRYSTDIPVLYREVGLLESRLKPYLSIFLQDEKQMEEVVDAGKEFLKAFVARFSLMEYEEVLDNIELDFYERFKEAYLRHVNRSEMKRCEGHTHYEFNEF
jgi:hypothetical protein